MVAFMISFVRGILLSRKMVVRFTVIGNPRGCEMTIKIACSLLLTLSAWGLAQAGADPDPWRQEDMVEPATLAKVLASPEAPMVISVAFPVLYRNKHIVHALDAKAGSTPEGIQMLRKLVESTPKDADIVIYCGCCPMVKCPNVRPAFRALKEMGYTHIRVLDIPANMHMDWYSKGYPAEK